MCHLWEITCFVSVSKLCFRYYPSLKYHYYVDAEITF